MFLPRGLAGAEIDGVDHQVAVDREVEGVAEAAIEVGIAEPVLTGPVGVVVEDAGDDGEAEGDGALRMVGEIGADGLGLEAGERETANVDLIAPIGGLDGGRIGEVLHPDAVHVGQRLTVGAHLPVAVVAHHVEPEVGVVVGRDVGAGAGGKFDIASFVAPAVAKLLDRLG